MTKSDLILIIIAICAALLMIARQINIRAARDRPGCYGSYRPGDCRAMLDCENCELEFECEELAKERWKHL